MLSGIRAKTQVFIFLGYKIGIKIRKNTFVFKKRKLSLNSVILKVLMRSFRNFFTFRV